MNIIALDDPKYKEKSIYRNMSNKQKKVVHRSGKNLEGSM